MGCRVFDNINQQGKSGWPQYLAWFHALFHSLVEGDVPPTPPRAPELILLPRHTNGAWRYQLNPGNTSLEFLEKDQDLEITSFLFRALHNAMDISMPLWLVRVKHKNLKYPQSLSLSTSCRSKGRMTRHNQGWIQDFRNGSTPITKMKGVHPPPTHGIHPG